MAGTSSLRKGPTDDHWVRFHLCNLQPLQPVQPKALPRLHRLHRLHATRGRAVSNGRPYRRRLRDEDVSDASDIATAAARFRGCTCRVETVTTTDPDHDGLYRIDVLHDSGCPVLATLGEAT